MDKKYFPAYGYAGIVLILFAELFVGLDRLTDADWSAVTMWTTPICWWGYILFVDALVPRLKGESLIRTRPREFVFQVPISFILWLIFEGYNLHLKNWAYVGLPENAGVAWAGRFLSFGTILPALLETNELLETLGVFSRMKIVAVRPDRRIIYGAILLGLCLCIVPLLLGEEVAKYLFVLVWIGFFFLLDPIVYSSGGKSLLGELEKGSLSRIFSLAAAGYICGFLWEFWNYWAATKWVYLAPFTQSARIFEMPMAGFLGFGPFAWEFFCMYQFVRLMGRGR